MDIESWKNRSQEDILAAIREKSALIVQQQRIADKGGFRSVEGALGLQRLRNDRKALQGLLKIQLVEVE